MPIRDHLRVRRGQLHSMLHTFSHFSLGMTTTDMDFLVLIHVSGVLYTCRFRLQLV